MSSRLIAGCMTGTSLDGLDAALIAIEGHGLAMSARFIRAVSRPLGVIAEPLRRLADQQPMTAGDIARASRDFALLHADALRELAGSDKLDLACIHGQTVFHAPPLSWQLFNPFPIARAVTCPIVYDLRSADIAAGGQGAPITPIADYILFGVEPRTIINLGGFCNVTQLNHLDPRDMDWNGHEDAVQYIKAGDVCSCNQLLDGLARLRLNAPFDPDGENAMKGIWNQPAFDQLRAMLTDQVAHRRSLGTGDELLGRLQQFSAVRTADLLRAACEAIADVVLEHWSGQPILAGGGVKNRALIRAFRDRAQTQGRRLHISDDLGIPASHREAICFAVLGALCQDRTPITLAQVTGVPAPAPISGAWVFP